MSNHSDAIPTQPATMSITTEVFTPGAATHAAETMRNRLNKLWAPLALPIAILAIAGTADWRWIIVAGALLLTVYPFGVIAGWFGALANRSAVMAVYPQQTTLSHDGNLTVIYHPLPHPDGSTADNTPPRRQPSPIVIPATHLCDCQLRKNSIYLSFSSNAPIDRLIIPVGAFKSPDDCRLFYHTLSQAIVSREAAD